MSRLKAAVDKIRHILRSHSSPTMGQGDVHGGQSGFIVYEPSIPFIAQAVLEELTLVALQPDAALVNTKPVVLYFPTDEDRDNFVAAMQGMFPGLQTKNL